jgi:glutathione reductase (NADPH)
MTTSFDLIVLGAGSGGIATAMRAARHGAHVALVDPGKLGGTCVHRGCVPKKALWFAAQLAQAQSLAVAYGFDLQPGRLDWEKFRWLREQHIDAIQQRYAQRMCDAGVQRFDHAGHFVTRDTVELEDGHRLSAPHVVIATGARPRRLDLPGFELGSVSDDAFAWRQLPQRVVIVGGGYVAMEFAGLLQTLGSEVRLMARGSLLQGFDDELVQSLAGQMREQGITIDMHSDIRAVRRDGSSVLLDDTVSGMEVSCDALLWAVGRVPNAAQLGLSAIGVETDEHGHVTTDEWQDTSIVGIHALGDVTARKALTPVAVAAGRHLADRLFDGRAEAKLDYAGIPTLVFAEPPLGMVGLTEAAARERHGSDVVVHRSRFTPMQWSLAGRSGQSMMKLVCVGAEELVVGIHALGPGADEILQGFAVALKLGLRKRDLDATVALHPTSGEEMVLMDLA